MSTPVPTARNGEKPPYAFQKPEGLLAHYTKSSAVFEKILPCGELRMSSYGKMRDPAESQDILPAIGWGGEQPAADTTWQAVKDHLKAARDAMRVLAFTRDVGDGVFGAFDCSWARPRMWEQYGDNHGGACLLFDRDRLERTLRDELGEHVYLQNVSYDRQALPVAQVR
jgi:hypothetical protein